MNFSNPYSRDLGVFTWAELQAAYPNGGGALAALPAGAYAFVTDWETAFYPNAGKTRWITPGRFTLYRLAAAATINTTTPTIYAQTPLPAGLLAARDTLRVEISAHDNGTSTIWNGWVYIGTAGTTSDAQISLNIDLSNAAQRTFGFTNGFVVESNTVVNSFGKETSWVGATYQLHGITAATRTAGVTVPSLSSSANVLSVSAYGDNTTDTLTINHILISVDGQQ